MGKLCKPSCSNSRRPRGWAWCAQGEFALHWPLINSAHMRTRLAQRELEAKRLEDARRCATAVIVLRAMPPQAACELHRQEVNQQLKGCVKKASYSPLLFLLCAILGLLPDRTRHMACFSVAVTRMFLL